MLGVRPKPSPFEIHTGCKLLQVVTGAVPPIVPYISPRPTPTAGISYCRYRPEIEVRSPTGVRGNVNALKGGPHEVLASKSLRDRSASPALTYPEGYTRVHVSINSVTMLERFVYVLSTSMKIPSSCRECSGRWTGLVSVTQKPDCVTCDNIGPLTSFIVRSSSASSFNNAAAKIVLNTSKVVQNCDFYFHSFALAELVSNVMWQWHKQGIHIY